MEWFISNICLCQAGTLCYKIWSQLYMHITSCAYQQLLMVLRTVAYLSAHEWVHVPSPNHWGRKPAINLSQSGECSMAPEENLLPSAVRICDFWVLWFLLYAFFLLNNSVCSVRAIKYVWQSHYLRCIHCWHSLVCVFLPCALVWWGTGVTKQWQ
jgi:hypothetical protein